MKVKRKRRPLECKPSGQADTFPSTPITCTLKVCTIFIILYYSWRSDKYLDCCYYQREVIQRAELWGHEKSKATALCVMTSLISLTKHLSHRVQTMMQVSRVPCKLLFNWVESQTAWNLVTKLIRLAMFSADTLLLIFWINTCFKCGREWW
jgi:hypothetical protein